MGLLAALPKDAISERDSGDYPLWRSVPVRPFVVLDEGRLRGTRWGIYAFRGRGKTGGERPCLTVVTLSARGEVGHSSECGPLAPESGPDVPPITVLMGGTYELPNGEVVGEAVVGMSFAQSLAKARISLEPGGSVMSKTRYLSAKQAKKSHVDRFRYLALPLQRDVCVKHVTGFSRDGQTFLDANDDECR